MIGRTNVGGAGLNFKVVGGTLQPTNASENTIWVETDDEITSWIFSPDEPGTPEEGMVWISTGTSGQAAFNALKKNCIQVHPNYAKQVANGVWIGYGAWIFQNGEWKELKAYFYEPGNVYSDITGGYTSDGGNSVIKFTEEYMQTTTESGNTISRACSNNAIDFSGYTTLFFEVLTYNGTYAGSNTPWVGVSSTKDADSANMVAYATIEQSTESTVYSVDVSELSGAFYIAWRVGIKTASSQYIRISRIWAM